ncbi:MAG: hypothetical protein RBQ99_07880 [Trichlorobacter sp.]|nr:hypothetical protein [Trichlorobacter sp.]
MSSFNSTEIAALEKKILDCKRNPKLVPHGYPVSTVSDLLETVREQKNLKKKYQRLAQMRGQVIMEIFSITSRAVDRTTEELSE